MDNRIKVLIVDDSALVRQALSSIIEKDPMLKVMGSASDPFVAAKMIQQDVPDVITLDVEMPRMDGLTFLKKIMSQHPIPTIVISTLTSKGTETGLRALEYGAVDIITKPKLDTKKFIEESSIRICDSIKAAAISKIKRKTVFTSTHDVKVEPKLSADAVLDRPSTYSMLKTTEKIIVLGASTGGTEAIKEVLVNLPYDCPGIAIVQHMPEMFTKSFANRLNDICNIKVKEAENGDAILRGQALIAPGNAHMLVKRSGAKYYVEIKEGPLVNRHRPSVDVLFRSAARYAGANAIGIILTGMGADGAKGMMEMKEAGAKNIAQDEKSCVVFGMPKEAIAEGGVDKILPLSEIHKYIMNTKLI